MKLHSTPSIGVPKSTTHSIQRLKEAKSLIREASRKLDMSPDFNPRGVLYILDSAETKFSEVDPVLKVLAPMEKWIGDLKQKYLEFVRQAVSEEDLMLLASVYRNINKAAATKEKSVVNFYLVDAEAVLNMVENKDTEFVEKCRGAIDRLRNGLKRRNELGVV